MGIRSNMVVSVASASASPVLMTDHDTESPRKTAGKVISLGRAKIPSRDEYLKAFAGLIWVTFEGPSAEAKCLDAVRKTGLASPDTWARFLRHDTQKPDAYLVDVVKLLAHHKQVKIPAALMVTQ